MPRDRRSAWLVLGMIASVCAISPAAQAQLDSVERRGPGAAVPPPSPRQVEPIAPPTTVDPSGVWFYVRRQDATRARAELERLRADNPGWQVPNDLTTAVTGIGAVRPTQAGDATNQRVTAAEAGIRRGKIDPVALKALIAPLQHRTDSGAAERLGRALLETSDPALARDWFQRALTWARPNSDQQTAAVFGLVKTEAALGLWDAAQRHVAVLASGMSHDQAAQILADAAGTGAEAAAKAGDWATADHLATIAEATGPSRVRTDLGWAALDAGDNARAAASFAAGPQDEESRFGRTLALSQMSGQAGGDLTALAAACAPADRSDRQTQACGDAFAARALERYNAQDWDAVIALDKAAANLGLARPGTRLLTGWSYYRQRNYAEALRAFDDAIASEPDAADGIAQSLIAVGRYADLEARAGSNPRLLTAYRQNIGPLALIRQRSLLASSLDAPNTGGIAAPSFSIGIFGRDKSGASGADRMSLVGESVTASTVFGTQKFNVDVETDHLRIGTPTAGAPIGSLQTSTPLTNHVATLTTPTFRWDDEGIDRAYSVIVGTTPISGEIGAVPVAVVSAERDWDTLIATASLRATPRYDSLLAMSGLHDGATGAVWGRVVEIGPQANAIVLLNEHLSISGTVSASSITGRDVANNDHIATAWSLTYEIHATGFDYVRVGPSYAFDHYNRNENFFTLGNGGYYSPDAGHSLGAFVDFLTNQGRTWLVGARLNAAYQHSNESAEAVFPLADNGNRFAGITQSQFGTDSTVRAAALLGPHVILGAFGRVTYAPSGRDMAAGLTLTIPFGARSGLFSGDLPHFADRSWP